MLGRLRSPECPYGFVKCCGFLAGNAGFLYSFSDANGIGVKAADTTGAGDSLIGSFLGYLAQSSCMEKGLDNITASECGRMLERAVAFSAYSVTQKGAIASYPDKAQLDEFIGKICMKEG